MTAPSRLGAQMEIDLDEKLRVSVLRNFEFTIAA